MLLMDHKRLSLCNALLRTAAHALSAADICNIFYYIYLVNPCPVIFTMIQVTIVLHAGSSRFCRILHQ